MLVLSECIISFGEGLCTPYSMYCILCAGEGIIICGSLIYQTPRYTIGYDIPDSKVHDSTLYPQSLVQSVDGSEIGRMRKKNLVVWAVVAVGGV